MVIVFIYFFQNTHILSTIIYTITSFTFN